MSKPHLVVRPPLWILLLAGVYGLGAVGYLAYRGLSGQPLLPSDPRTLMLLGLGAVLGIGLIAGFDYRIEVDDDELRTHWWGKTRKRFPLDELTKVELAGAGRRLTFADGRKLQVPDAFHGAQALAVAAQRLADAHAATPVRRTRGAPRRKQTGRKRKLRMTSLTFPDQCVRCSAPARADCAIEAWSGIDLIAWSVKTEATVRVPTCARCGGKREQVQWALNAGFFLACGAVIGSLALDVPTALKVGGFCGGLLFMVLWNRGTLERWADRLLLGVWGVGAKQADVTLGFSSLKLADATEELTLERWNADVRETRRRRKQRRGGSERLVRV